VKTHSDSMLTQLLHLDEVFSALRIKFFSPFRDYIAGGLDPHV
jgi:hypothetical protein